MFVSHIVDHRISLFVAGRCRKVHSLILHFLTRVNKSLCQLLQDAAWGGSRGAGRARDGTWDRHAADGCRPLRAPLIFAVSICQTWHDHWVNLFLAGRCTFNAVHRGPDNASVPIDISSQLAMPPKPEVSNKGAEFSKTIYPESSVCQT